MDMQITEGYFNWIQHRQTIFLKKEAGKPKPWTNDPTFQNYRFCNVFREQDKTTIWIDQNIRKVWSEHRYLWFALCVARRINLPSTLFELGELMVDWDSATVEETLDNISLQGKKVYSNSYMITTGRRPILKNTFTAYDCLGRVWLDRNIISEQLESLKYSSSGLEKAFKIFNSKYPGFGPFISYEVISDLRHTRYLEEAGDINSWANAGPGAVKGLNRIYSRPVKAKIGACQAVTEMQQLLNLSRSWLTGLPRLEMRDIEHTLCEYDKYLRIRYEKGFLRQRYNGTGE